MVVAAEATKSAERSVAAITIGRVIAAAGIVIILLVIVAVVLVATFTVMRVRTFFGTGPGYISTENSASDDTEPLSERLASDPTWAELTAAKEGRVIDIGEHGLGPRECDRFACREERVGSGDHLVG